jgi:hypothetical protein
MLVIEHICHGSNFTSLRLFKMNIRKTLMSTQSFNHPLNTCGLLKNVFVALFKVTI